MTTSQTSTSTSSNSVALWERQQIQLEELRVHPGFQLLVERLSSLHQRCLRTATESQSEVDIYRALGECKAYAKVSTLVLDMVRELKQSISGEPNG